MLLFFITLHAGVRVILLNCLSEFGVEVLRQAKDKGMTGPGWAWVVTDGMTGSVNSPLYSKMDALSLFDINTYIAVFSNPLYFKSHFMFLLWQKCLDRNKPNVLSLWLVRFIFSLYKHPAL